jgi:hypothetical protein
MLRVQLAEMELHAAAGDEVLAAAAAHLRAAIDVLDAHPARVGQD